MSIPKISQSTIHRNANEQSFDRGQDYYHRSAVTRVTRRGNIVQAEVEGSQVNPYCVTLNFDAGGFTSTQCTYPFDWGGWCKHIVATMLVCLHEPESIEERPTLEKLLDRLDHIQTQRLVQNLVKKQPELIDEIEFQVNLIVTPKSEGRPVKSPRRTSIDPAPFRLQVKQILRDASRYLEEGYEEDPITPEIEELIQQAQQFTQQGDSYNALVILQAIAEACMEEWDDVEEYGADSGEIIYQLNEAFTEAIISCELSREDQVDIQVNLENLQDEWNAELAMSLEALRQGWDDPQLQRILQGDITAKLWNYEAPYYADDLAKIRLQILDRQERYQEYLYLAEAEGQTQQYLTMLGRLGQVQDAMNAAKSKMNSIEQAFALAQILRDHGSLNEALEIAQMGLNLPGNYRYNLALWTSELAEGLEQHQIALNARIMAFQARPSFADYCKVEELAGESWSTVKPELLKALRTDTNWGVGHAKVDIFLYEGLIDDAIATVSTFSLYDSDLTHRVMKAAIAHRPDWVIENAISLAESIMNAGKSESYDHAVEWLKKVRAGYLQTERKFEWSAYRAELMKTHARKYKLMGLLKQRDLE